MKNKHNKPPSGGFYILIINLKTVISGYKKTPHDFGGVFLYLFL